MDIEEDEPALDPAWPYLQIVYDLLLKFIASSNTDPKVVKKYLDHNHAPSLFVNLRNFSIFCFSSFSIQMPETTKATANDSATMSGSLVSYFGATVDFLETHDLKTRQTLDTICAFLRLLCMVSAHSSGLVAIYGFNLQVNAKWSCERWTL
ncbi:hypothetical protein AMTR_s00003p00269810 [Amborella trichopoda]|uniref:Uncharacterized protein n=1 Tax=Amborella trichopoda TaxID=13333 RepID=W1P7C2_AMBTC|nr:hypothetical protein AMTR_s00003p00269810 [Amborella trichopoda]